MTARKSERLMNLTICLLVSRSFISKERIREAVEGYHGLTDDAFDRMFDRDKEELRVIGVPIETGTVDKVFEDEPGYRIRRADFELPEVRFAADEAAVLGLAARVWQQARLASASSRALRRMRAGGADLDEERLQVLEPRLDSNEAAFDPILDAVMSQTPVGFEYQAAGADVPSARRLEPWGILSWHGHWYVVGQDRDRGAPRMFRLSRFTGPVTPDGSPGDFRRPENTALRDLAGTLAPTEPRNTATVRLRHGAGEALRRRAVTVREDGDGWSEVDLPYAREGALVDEVLDLGADAVVVSPEEVRTMVVRRLREIVTEGEQ